MQWCCAIICDYILVRYYYVAIQLLTIHMKRQLLETVFELGRQMGTFHATWYRVVLVDVLWKDLILAQSTNSKPLGRSG